MWRRSALEVVEGVLGRPAPGGVTVMDPHLERGSLEVDGLALDGDGIPIHVEFQTRADRELGARMARYFTALNDHGGPAPEQHVVLLHPDADYPGIGVYRRGRLELGYEVHRLWELDPEALLGRSGLLRLVPLARPPASGDRKELLAQVAAAIPETLAGDDAASTAYWAGQLATLYLSPQVIAETLEALRMPIDLSHTVWAQELRAEGRRDAVQQIVLARFGDAELADRAAAVPDELLEEAIQVTATVTSVTEIKSWLEDQRG